MTEAPPPTPTETMPTPQGSGAPLPPALRHVDPPSSMNFWTRLKEHKVVQWTLAYAAAAYTLLHGVEMLSEAQEWPHIIVRVFSLVIILGVPLVVTLAWYHGAKALKRISGPELAIVTILLFIAGTILWVVSRPSAERPAAESAQQLATPAAPRTAVAVLPFANLTGDASKEYLGDGMAEELINTLTKVQGLKVPARTSSFAYKGRNINIRNIAKDLQVGTILEGSVRAAGKRIRITAQLIDAQDGLHIWSETYDEEFTDIFKLQDKLATQIARALQPSLGEAAQAVVAQAPPTQDLEAYQFYLQGSSVADRISEQNENRAIHYFQQAIARDPKFARAYAGVGFAHLRMGTTLNLRPFEHFAAAERTSRQALALDPNIASARNTLAVVNDLRGNWLEGEAHSAASLSLGSNDGNVRTYRSLHQVRGGHLHEALAEGRRALELAPANPYVIANLAGRYSESRRDAEALKYGDLAVELGYPKDNEPLASVYSDAALRAGHYADAAEIATKALNVSDPEQARTAEVIQLVHAALANPGQRASALVALGHLYPPPATATSSAADLTSVGPCLESSYRYALLGVLDAAYGLANQCLDRMAPGAVNGGRSTIRLWSPWLRPFRQDPRFQAFASRLGLMEYWQQYGPPDDCVLITTQS